MLGRVQRFFYDTKQATREGLIWGQIGGSLLVAAYYHLVNENELADPETSMFIKLQMAAAIYNGGALLGSAFGGISAAIDSCCHRAKK